MKALSGSGSTSHGRAGRALDCAHLHAVIFSQTDDLLDEILVPQRRLTRRERKGIVCAVAKARLSRAMPRITRRTTVAAFQMLLEL